MVEYLLTICIFFVVIYALFKGCNLNVNITVKQEFSHEDRALLEDLFNEKGEYKDRENEINNALEETVRAVNAIMLGDEENE